MNNLIKALIPGMPLIEKVADKKSLSNLVVEKTTYQTELAQAGYFAVIASVIYTLMNCEQGLSMASLSCISEAQWGALLYTVSQAYLRIKQKTLG